jgi:hypothetical protein
VGWSLKSLIVKGKCGRMKLQKPTTEIFLYGLAFVIAAAIRFIGLGSVPLSDAEANWALQALAIARGGHVVLGPQPGYLLLTGASFFVFGATDFMARFWPALAGTVLVLSPYLFREQLGRKAAVILAFALALEPSLAAASRQADGRMIGLAAIVFAVGFLSRRNLAWGGIALGLSLFGGPSTWNGLIGVGLGLSASRLTAGKPAENENAVPLNTRALLIWTGGTILLLGTLFGFVPGGLSAVGEGLVSYLRGWVSGSGVPVLLMLVAWIGLSPLVFLFGSVGVVRELIGRKMANPGLVWIWAFVFLLALAYPARQTADLAMAAVPFLALGARQAAQLRQPFENKVPAWGYTLLVAVLGASIYLNYASQISAIVPGQDALRWGGMLGALFLILASFFLVAWGWSWKVAGTGIIFGIGGLLLMYTLMTTWSGAGLSVNPGNELWVEGNYANGETLTLKVLGDVSEWNSGLRNSLDLLVSGVDSPSLRWALRDYRNVNFVSQLPPDAQPSVVLTPVIQGTNLGLPAPYTGQGLDWAQRVNWTVFQFGDWTRWLSYRDLTTQTGLVSYQKVILWLRSDLFPGAAKTIPVQ